MKSASVSRFAYFVIVFSTLVLLSMSSGCSTLSADLRDDLNNNPYGAHQSVGGSYPEGGLLDEPTASQYPYGRDSGRRPASADGRFAGQPDSWISGAQVQANQRDRLRRSPSYREAPNYYNGAQRNYRPGKRVTREDFVDRSESEGSLWASNGQTNYFFVKNKIRTIGDIVTIKADEALVSNVGHEIKKTLTPPEVEVELRRAQEKINAEHLAKTAEQRKPAAEGSAGAPIDDVEDAREATFADIDLKGVVGIKAEDMLMAEIVDRYPNGNYKLRAIKRVPYGGGIRMVTLLGVAKDTEINDDEMVEAGKLYEYRLSVLR